MTTGKISIIAAAVALAIGGTLAHAQDAAQPRAAARSEAKAEAKGAAKGEGKAEAKGLPRRPMSFFVTSTNPGKGADLGGLAGADRHCQDLAKAAGAGNRTWHAYLSTTDNDGGKTVNARDRIGKGPWYNASGELIARNVDELHADNNINKNTALTEKGGRVNVRGDTPNMHDILTGSDSFGYAYKGVKDDTTCGNWTKNVPGGSAQLGHVDRAGLNDLAPAKSWNSAHGSRGCTMDNLRSSGGGGLFYCFASR